MAEKTSENYKTNNIPQRFEHPDVFEGYGKKPQHPMYTTEANTYGSKPPSVHTVPLCFHARSQGFTGHLAKCGMPRNFGFNTSSDKHYID